MQQFYDLHLSAYAISPETIARVEQLGFRRDLFANNTRCDTTAYHGTYRGSVALPNDSLWSALATLLESARGFIGSLEQESYSPLDVQFVVTTTEGTFCPPIPIVHSFPQPGRHKQCDIHVNVALDRSNPLAVRLIEQLEFASFDKPQADGVHRVWSITCDDFHAGELLRDALLDYLSRIAGLSAKLKFERTDRFLRIPSNAPSLPMVDAEAVADWISKSSRPFSNVL